MQRCILSPSFYLASLKAWILWRHLLCLDDRDLPGGSTVQCIIQKDSVNDDGGNGQWADTKNTQAQSEYNS